MYDIVNPYATPIHDHVCKDGSVIPQNEFLMQMLKLSIAKIRNDVRLTADEKELKIKTMFEAIAVVDTTPINILSRG